MLSDSRRQQQLHSILLAALDEDVGRGDATEAVVAPITEGHWKLIAREDGVLCGADVAEELFHLAGLNMEIILHKEDSDSFKAGDVLQEYKGDSSLMMVERILLNTIQHLSAISSESARWAATIANTPCRVYDTRKTTPGWRFLEKFAVKCGGAENHRMALDDAIMIKDNHHARQGHPKGNELTTWIKNIVDSANVPVIVEVENFQDCLDVARAEPAVILLDNMSNNDMTQCAHSIKSLPLDNIPELEASGGVTLERLPAIAATGVDRVSVGALTQNAPRIDIGLDAQ